MLRYSTLRKLLEPVAISLSDQQIATGISLCASTLFSKVRCTVNVYHYDVICNLVLISILSHLAGTLGLRGYTTHKPKALGLVRIVLMTVQAVFVAMLFWKRHESNFPTQAQTGTDYLNTPFILAVACFQNGANETLLQEFDTDHSSGGIGLLAFVFIFYLLMLTVAWLQMLCIDYQAGPSEGEMPNWSGDTGDRLRIILGWTRPVIIVYTTAVLIVTALDLLKLRSWMGASGWLGKDNDENEWTFGQLLPVVLTGFTLLAFLDAVPDYLDARAKAAPGASNNDDDKD